MCILWIVGGTQRYANLILFWQRDIYVIVLFARSSTVSAIICSDEDLSNLGDFMQRPWTAFIDLVNAALSRLSNLL